MKHPQNPRRGRGRNPGSGKRHQPSKNRNFESSGGENKVRGNAQQVLDKYQAMARDAAAAGEHIQAEGYWQHAEHYFRILNADRDDRPVNRGNDEQQGDKGGEVNSDETGTRPQSEEQPKAESQPKSESRPQARPRPRMVTRPQTTPQMEKAQVREIPIETPIGIPARISAELPVSDASEAKPIEQVQPDVPAEVEKPKRRGRPRKVAVAPDDAAESPDADASSETVSA